MIKIKILLAISLTIAVVAGKEDKDPWAFNKGLGESQTVVCNDSRHEVESGDVAKWTTPIGVQLDDGHDDASYKIIDENGVKGYSLQIKKITEKDHGIYYCHVYNGTSAKLRLIRGLNLGAKFIRGVNASIIIAVIATAVFFVPFVGTCAVYKFRYKTGDEKTSEGYREGYGDRYGDGYGMQERTAAYAVKSDEGNGAYINPSTNL